MRCIVIISVALAGCISVHGAAGLSGAIDGPTRTVSAGLGAGAWASKGSTLGEVEVTQERGPLGRDSAWLKVVAVQLSTLSHGGTPGFFGRIGTDLKEADSDLFEAGAGLVWTSVSRATSDAEASAFAALHLGIRFRHQHEDDLGTGDFLGVELEISAGVNGHEAVGGDPARN